MGNSCYVLFLGSIPCFRYENNEVLVPSGVSWKQTDFGLSKLEFAPAFDIFVLVPDCQDNIYDFQIGDIIINNKKHKIFILSVIHS